MITKVKQVNENIIDYLKTRGIKPSIQRVEVMRYLLSHKTHPTVEEIYDNLSTTMPTLSKTTIYNTLKLFIDNRAAVALTIDDKSVHYDGDVTNHAHFKCNSCGKLYDFYQPIINHQMQNGFRIDECHLYYRGLCPDCLKREDRELI